MPRLLPSPTYVLWRQVVADRKRRLEQQVRSGRRRDDPAVVLDSDVAPAVHDVDAVKRVARVADIGFVLLMPGVKAIESPMT